MIAYRLVPFHIARKLYDLGYKGGTEYHYPITKAGTKYKTQETIAHIEVSEKEIDCNTIVTKFECYTDFDENRLSAPSIWEAQEWLLEEYNILIDAYSYRSRGDYRNCKWFIDINKRAEVYNTGRRRFFNSRTEAIQVGIELVVNKLITDLKN